MIARTALRRLSTRPPVAAKGDTSFVIERRKFREELHNMRKRFQQEQEQRSADVSAAAEAEREQARQVKQARLDLRRRRAAESQAHLDKLRQEALVKLEEDRASSSHKALACHQARVAHMSVRVNALAADSASWISEDTLEERISSALFTEIVSPVNDTPSVRRKVQDAEDDLSGKAADHDLLVQLAHERSADLPIWLRHSVLPPGHKGND
mmetsp:Transcript_4063/g.11546  ORF Transcript_4063/g.11546 Transcript_4063/m.11546 type:complete len:211 (+) Transcript_4063:57-689(+)